VAGARIGMADTSRDWALAPAHYKGDKPAVAPADRTVVAPADKTGETMAVELERNGDT
jgi:hypothetical protein